mgnify:CR=1 FL=1
MRLTLDDRFGTQYGSRTANGATRRGHQGGVGVNAQQLAGNVAYEQGAANDDGVNQYGRQSDFGYLLEGKAETVEHDTRAQNLFGAELDAGHPGFGNEVAEAVGVKHTQNDTHNERAQRQAFYPLEAADVAG